MAYRGTRVDVIVARFKDHPATAVLIVAGLVVIALSSFTDATRKMLNVATGLRPGAVEVTVGSGAVSLRWSAWKAGLGEGLWHPVRRTAYESELRLPLTFMNSGPKALTIVGINVLSEANGRRLSWEAVYEADTTALERNAPVESQIRAHRTQLAPFVIAPNGGVFKIIDFVPSDHPEPLPKGTYRNTLQIRKSSSKDWTDSLRFAFTVPADFELEGGNFWGYNHWHTFPISKD